MSATRIASGVVSRGEAVHRSGSPFTTELDSSRLNNPFQNTVLQQSQGRDDAVVFSDRGGHGRTSARGGSHSLFIPPEVRQPTAGGDAPVSTDIGEAQSESDATVEPNIQQYIYFIASLSAEAAERRGEDFSTSFREKANELSKSVSEGGEVGAEFRVEQSSTIVTAASAQLLVEDGALSFAAAAALHAEASVDAEFVASDGTHFRVQASIEVDAAISVSFHAQQNKKTDPLVLDIDGDGEFSLSDVENGVRFDIDADGRTDQSAFVIGADAFLGLDRNRNGQIDDGSELFGDQHGANNGFEELRKFDSDGNGVIDASDSVFQSLVGVQRQADGRLHSHSLSELQVDLISLEYQNVSHETTGENTLAQISRYLSGEQNRVAGDVLLSYRKLA